MDEAQKILIKKVGVLYQKYGIRSVTMDDVAKNLGISKKTLYSIVKDKNELVEKVVDGQLEIQKQEDDKFKELEHNAFEEMLFVFKTVSELLRKMNPSYHYDLNKYYPHLCEKFMTSKRDHLYNNIKQNLIKGKKEGIYRKEINEDIIAKMNTDLNISMMNKGDESIPWFNTETFQEIFLYHIHAILNDKGRELLKQKQFSKI